MKEGGYVYILAARKNGTMYTGVTADLPKRVWEHKNAAASGFTKKYGVNLLVYFEHCPGIAAAIAREKQIKKWRRRWKVQLIEKENPEWKDLYPDILQ
jgi:putative endonuclease